MISFQNQPQHPSFLASGDSLLVLNKETNSSAHVGCIPTTLSSYEYLIPNITAIENPYMTSPALGPK